MKILVTGAGGMLGSAVTDHCRALGDEVSAHNRQALDITNAAAIRTVFARERPQSVINCAAWTDVDGCELDSARAFAANAHGTELLAVNCREVGASLITVSTDYVFDGTKQGFYTQRDDPRPTSVYGASKLAGERLAQSSLARATVVRTGWIFGAGGRNFLSRVIELYKGGASLKAISDAYGTPTYAVDLATRLRELAELDLPGIYHVVNSGMGASFAEFAREALAAAAIDASRLETVSMNLLQRPAPRPRNSRLHCLISEAIGLAPLPDWRAALRDFVETNFPAA